MWIAISVSFAIGIGIVHRVWSQARKKGRPRKYSIVILPISFALSSALVGAAQMIVHSKAVAELFKLLFAGIPPNPFATWIFYVEFILLTICGILWLVRLENAV